MEKGGVPAPPHKQKPPHTQTHTAPEGARAADSLVVWAVTACQPRDGCTTSSDWLPERCTARQPLQIGGWELVALSGVPLAFVLLCGLGLPIRRDLVPFSSREFSAQGCPLHAVLWKSATLGQNWIGDGMA